MLRRNRPTRACATARGERRDCRCVALAAPSLGLAPTHEVVANEHILTVLDAEMGRSAFTICEWLVEIIGRRIRSRETPAEREHLYTGDRDLPVPRHRVPDWLATLLALVRQRHRSSFRSRSIQDPCQRITRPRPRDSRASAPRARGRGSRPREC